MKIDKISSINAASFVDYRWPHELPNLERVNIALGWNGSGKTVISRIFRSLESGALTNLPPDAEFALNSSGRTFTQTNLSGLEKSIRVFNEDYIEEIIGRDSLPYVVYIGEGSKDYSEKETLVKKLREELGAMNRGDDTHNAIAEEIAKNIKLIDGIANIQKELEPSGFFTSYNKSSFEKRVKAIADAIDAGGNLNDFVCSDDEIRKAKSQLANQESEKRDFDLLKRWDDWLLNGLEGINKALVSEPIYESSARISSHKGEEKIYSWIRDGIELHKLTDKKSALPLCLFCNSTIGNSDELLKHFTNDVIRLNTELQDFLNNANNAIEQLGSISGAQKNLAAELIPTYRSLKERLENKVSNITEKCEEFQFISLLTAHPTAVQSLVDLAYQVEKYHVAEAYTKYMNAKNTFDACGVKIQSHSEQIKTAEGELASLKARAKNVHAPAEKLSGLLKVTFPHKSIELRDTADEIGYEIYRQGQRCDLSSLSEGERNFLAFAYFISTLNTQDISERPDADALIVIDDPVSSLDKDSIFQIFSIIAHEIDRNPDRQYLLLTHNLDFYSHLCLHFTKRDGDTAVQNAVLLQVAFDKDGSRIERIHEMLKNFKTDYQYSISLLWKKKDSKEISDAYHTVNLLRRVWETLLHFKYGHGDFRGKLKQIYDQALKKQKEMMAGASQIALDAKTEEFQQSYFAMYRFANYGSHEFTSTESFDVSILADADRRINNFFDVLKLVDLDHYKHVTNL